MTSEKHFTKLPLWPSHAERWLNCPGQPRVSAAVMAAVGQRQSVYAEEGTKAHAYIEARLTKADAKSDLPAEQLRQLDEAVDDINFIKMMGGFNIYVERIFRYEAAHRVINCKIDILLFNEREVLVIDYKHGQGLLVHVDGNPQLSIYALAARKAFGRDKSYTVGILQPRGVGEGLVKAEVSHEYLDQLAIDVEAAAVRAYAPEATYNLGPWCKWCPGMKGFCPKVVNELVDTIAAKGKEEEDSEYVPWWILDAAPQVKEMVKTIEDLADDNLKNRIEVPGWKMIETKGRRRWVNPDEVPDVLAELVGGDRRQYCTTVERPIGITEAERLAKPRKVDLSALTEAPPSLKRVRDDDSGVDWVDAEAPEGFE